MGLLDNVFGRPRPRVGIELPTYRAPEAEVSTLDRITLSISGRESAGVIVATGPDVPNDQRWEIEHATAACTSSTPTTLLIYHGSIGVTNLLDGSSSGNFDTGEWPSSLLIPRGSRLVAAWTGCSAGATASLNLQISVTTGGRG
jgi:hypothetical protein